MDEEAKKRYHEATCPVCKKQWYSGDRLHHMTAADMATCCGVLHIDVRCPPHCLKVPRSSSYPSPSSIS